MSAHQLLRGQQDDHDQGVIGHLHRHRLRTVHAVPAALLRVAALVTSAVGVVSDAVGLVHGVAQFLLPAVVVVEEAVGVVAGLVALAVVEEAPAARVRTAGPGVHHQRAVAPVPLAGVGVALFVAHAVFGLALAVGEVAGRQRGHSHHTEVLAALPLVAGETDAAEVGETGLLRAYSFV